MKVRAGRATVQNYLLKNTKFVSMHRGVQRCLNLAHDFNLNDIEVCSAVIHRIKAGSFMVILYQTMRRNKPRLPARVTNANLAFDLVLGGEAVERRFNDCSLAKATVRGRTAALKMSFSASGYSQNFRGA